MVKKIFGFTRRFILRLIPAVVCLAALAAFMPYVPYETSAVGVSDVKSSELSFVINDIYVDGERFDNYSLERAVFASDDGRIFVPADEEFLYALGIRYREDKTGRVLAFRRVKPDKSLLREDRGQLVNDNFSAKLVLENSGSRDVMVLLCEQYSDLMGLKLRDESCRENYFIREWFASNIRLLEDLAVPGVDILDYAGEGLLVASDGSLWFGEELLGKLGVSVWYDQMTGVWISTDPEWNSTIIEDRDAAIAWKDTIARYIMKENHRLSYEDAIYYEYLYRHAATVYGLDELVVIAVAEEESDFNAKDEYKGAIGLMQTLEKYAGKYGYTREMLFDPHHSLHLGCMYLRDRFARFDDATMALTAYNQGIGTVQRGNYSLKYATKVLGHRDDLKKLLDEAGASI